MLKFSENTEMPSATQIEESAMLDHGHHVTQALGSDIEAQGRGIQDHVRDSLAEEKDVHARGWNQMRPTVVN